MADLTQNAGENPLRRDLVPEPILRLLARLRDKVNEADRELQSISWAMDGEGVDRSPFLVDVLRASQRSIDAATDLRALTTAYAHAFHQPKPVVARLAGAQGASSAGLLKRYTPNHVDAINELLSDSPEPAVIIRALKSIGRDDLPKITNALDDALAKARGDVGQRGQSTRHLQP